MIRRWTKYPIRPSFKPRGGPSLHCFHCRSRPAVIVVFVNSNPNLVPRSAVTPLSSRLSSFHFHFQRGGGVLRPLRLRPPLISRQFRFDIGKLDIDCLLALRVDAPHNDGALSNPSLVYPSLCVSGWLLIDPRCALPDSLQH
jgi:hypothetical protein